MKFCRNCGNEMQDGEMVCKYCGTSSASGAAVHQETFNNMNGMQGAGQMNANGMNGNQMYRMQNNYNNNYQPNNNDGWDYTPISMWGYFGWELLFAIPLVGFILLLVFSFGGTRRINLRNFARSYFCLLLALIALAVLAMMAGAACVGGMYW